MGLSLRKGGNISLSKEGGASLNKIIIGVGWDERATDGSDVDLDANVFLLDGNGKVRSDADFIFYNQLKSACGSVEHMGDNLTGGDDGDDEQIVIMLQEVPADVHKVAVTVTIYDAEANGQNFGMVSNAFIRVVDNNNGKEMLRYDLSVDSDTETAMIFAEVYRYRGDWKFKAIGQGFVGGLGPLARHFGVNI